MFEQHPVPQNISSYQFHLVGDMTLKQFLELAAGVLVGVLFYATQLPNLIKWPLILFSAGMGAALAFIPFEERPLERWIIAFFRSVYSPTLFNWKRVDGVKYFQDETPGTAEGAITDAPTKPSSILRVPFLAKLEETENSYLTKISALFTPPPASPAGVANVTGVQAAPQPLMTSVAVKRDVMIPQKTFVSLANDNGDNRHGVVVQEIPQGSEVSIPTRLNETLTKQQFAPSQQAQFSANAAPPSLPTIPNTISGQVMDKDGKIVAGAILEIIDDKGRPVRALRSNNLGHFLIVTPLANGSYKVLAEKEGLNFDPLEFQTTGTIIQPIAIKAKV